MHVALADGMVEDLRRLRRMNDIVRQASEAGTEIRDDEGRPYKYVPLLEVSPATGMLAVLARRVLESIPPRDPVRFYRRLEYRLMSQLYAGLGSGAGNDELLSYLLFDRAFARKQIELGRADARATLARMHRPEADRSLPSTTVERIAARREPAFRARDVGGGDHPQGT